MSSTWSMLSPGSLHESSNLFQEAEERKVCERRWQLPIGKLVADGLCIPGLFASTVQWRDTVVQLQLPSGPGASRRFPQQALENFNRGDYVRIQTHRQQTGAAKGDDSSSPAEFTLSGTLCDLSSTTALVELEDPPLAILQQAKQSKLVWRFDLGFNTITYERMKKGLNNLCKQAPQSQALQFIIDSHHTSPSSGLTLQHPKAICPLLATSQSLNSSQQQAVATALDSRVSLIQGPPGTGKTQTCGAILCELANSYGKGKVLACAFNNVAIDELSKRTKSIGGEGLKVVRLGEPSRSDPEAQCLALSSMERDMASNLKEEILQAHAMVKEARQKRDRRARDGNAAHRLQAKYRNELQELLSKKTKKQTGKGGKANHPPQQAQQEAEAKLKHTKAEQARLESAIGAQRQIKEAAFADETALDNTVGPLLGKLKALEDRLKEVRRQIIASADVLCCTCIGAGSKELRGFEFSAILVDECTQAMEPACLVPLLKLVDGLSPTLEPARLVLAGDHKQLPPTVVSGHGSSPLSKSLFERMMQRLHLAPSHLSLASRMLSVQYRMHSQISAFPSQQFYGGQLQNGTSDTDRALPLLAMQNAMEQTLGEPLPGVWKESTPHILLVDIDGIEGAQEVQADTSKVNHGSAAMVRKMAWALLENKVVKSEAGIGVITLYAKQRKLLVSAGGSGGGSKKTKEKLNLPDEVEVKTVDGFQGREKDIIILDTVRCNASGQIGFLKDERRLNVAITRARRLLVIVGSVSTLEASGSQPWMGLVAHFRQSGAVVSA